MKNVIIALAATFLSASMASAGETPSSEGAAVYFATLEDGDTVQGPVTVVFGLRGMGVAPAGTERDNTGHHHLFIDRAAFGEGAEDADLIEYGIPADENHVHYGGGQTEAVLDLGPGTHTLQMVLGDLYHVPHNPPVVSDVITITVTE